MNTVEWSKFMPKQTPRHPKAKHFAFRTIGAGANAAWTAIGYLPRTPAKRTRVAIVHDGHVLLIQNVTNFRKWTLPGGGYHKDESALDCARREVREELGVNLPVDSLHATGEFTEKQRGTTYRFDTFVATLDSDPDLAISWELSHIRWVPLTDLPSNISSFIPKLLQKAALL